MAAVALALVTIAVFAEVARTPTPPARLQAHAALWTCGMHPDVIRDQPGLCPICQMQLTPLGVAAAPGDGTLTIDPVVVQNMGVRVAMVRRGPVTRQIRAAGYLAEAEPNIHDVSLRVSGWIETLHADTVGMHIAAGDPLFELYSPELQLAVEELIASRHGADVGSADSPLALATRRKLERYGLRPADVDRLGRLDRAPRSITFTSPTGGHLTEKLVVVGAAVKAGERILRIVDHATLWLDVQVHAQDLAAVTLGTPLRAVIDGARTAPSNHPRGAPSAAPASGAVESTVAFVHPHLDPITRTATVRAPIANPGLTLRPGMYATATIAVTSAPDALLVPREAVIDTGRRRLLFVATDAGKFQPRDVTLGASSDDGVVEILAGVAEGERVVTSGQFLLDAESRTQEAIQKHLGDRLLREQP